MIRIKSFLNKFCAISALSAAILIAGCGGGDSGNPNGPEPDPTEFETASIKPTEINKLYSETGLNTRNIAVDVPADGSRYLLNIANNSDKSISVKVCSSNANNDVRVSYAEDSQADIGEWTYDANIMARRAFAEAAKAHQNRVKSKVSAFRASSRCSTSNHSLETVGNEYSIQVGTIDKAPLVVLSKCKLVKITDHAKFFVDQNSHGGYSSRAAEMENLINIDGGLADLFERYMYGVLNDNYGTVADIDGDGKLSVLITSVLPSWQSGLQGLFPEETMIINPDDYCLDVRNPANNITDFRDLVLIAPPVNNSDEERHTMISNLIHETQHAVNLSQRAYSGNTYVKFDAVAFAQELGFDEGCSVAAEALFRRTMGKADELHSFEYRNGGPVTEYAGNTSKFNSYSLNTVFPFDDNNFNYDSHYGRNGLFMLYIHDCYGQEKYKKLVQQGWQGSNLKYTIPEILGCGSFDVLQTGWHIAMQYEGIRTQIGVTKNPGTIGYEDWLNLTLIDSVKSKPLNNIQAKVTANDTLKYYFQANNSASGANFRFFIKSADQISSLKNLKISLVKVANN